jgi:putative transposase
MLLEHNQEWSLNRRYIRLEGLQTVSDTVPTAPRSGLAE